MQVVFDTNALVTVHSGFRRFVGLLIRELTDTDGRPVFKLTVDQAGEILGEYNEVSKRLRDEGSADRYTILGQVCQFITNNRGTNLVAESDGNLLPLELADLPAGCRLPIEPSMFGIAHHAYAQPEPEPTFVYWLDDLCGYQPRGYPAHHNFIRTRYLPHNEQARQWLEILVADGSPPDTWNDMNKMLDAIKACGEPQEGERHEFKGTPPGSELVSPALVGVLSEKVLDELPSTVCAMLNKRGGTIFLGVDQKPNYAITGFKWASLGSDPDAARLKIESKLRSQDNGLGITSYPDERISVEIVKRIPTGQLGDDRMIVVVHVNRPKPEEARYCAKARKNGKVYKGIWIRSGSQSQLQKACAADCGGPHPK